MAFCKFSNELIISSSTAIDNLFINEFLPYAPESCVKVYLYGLYKCQNAESYDNTLENFSKVLGLSIEDVESAFLYWQEQGLVTVINVNPIEVKYLPLKSNYKNTKLFNKDKYSAFNKQAQALIEGRMITPTEYAEYYTLIESLHIQPEALIMIIKYCTLLKNTSVGYAYILTVAKNWAYEGVLTAEAVENKLLEHEQAIGDVKEILKLLGAKRNASFEEKQLLIKWKKDFGFTLDLILYVAKQMQKKGGIERLDKKLTKYFELKLFSVAEIEHYETNKEDLIKLAKTITKTIGVYYESLENVIDVYLNSWAQMGYSAEMLVLIADFCFKHGIKNLDGMNQTVLQFYKLGLVSKNAIEQYFNDVLHSENEIRDILDKLKLSRLVNSWDRDFYRTWTYVWNFSKEVINYACTLSVGKIQPINYMNKILSTWKQNEVSTVEQAKKLALNFDYEPQKTQKEFSLQRSYTPEEINALFDNLDEVKLKWLKMQ